MGFSGVSGAFQKPPGQYDSIGKRQQRLFFAHEDHRRKASIVPIKPTPPKRDEDRLLGETDWLDFKTLEALRTFYQQLIASVNAPNTPALSPQETVVEPNDTGR